MICDSMIFRRRGHMKYIIIAVVTVVVLLYIVITYNRLVTLRNKVRTQKSQIDVELKRRFDLIPSLVEIVKGYASHEKSALEDVVMARNVYMDTGDNTAQALDADYQLTGALSKLFILSENYPELKANINFLQLQRDLSDIEQKIVYSRHFYNDSVFKLNNKIEMFPSNIIAKLFSFNKENFFKALEAERTSVEVTLN